VLAGGSFKKYRPLSFCDRVFYRAPEDSRIALKYTKYVSIPALPESDHNAVVATMQLSF
jgi:hypothetical protein